MENFPIPNILFDNKFLNVFTDFIYAIYGILYLVIFAVLVFSLPVAYKRIRRKFPFKVNCWFCNTNTTVPYELSNGWDCPHCKQYNGFLQDGDYNKIIPEQYNLKLNEGIFNTFRRSVESKSDSLQTNGFCKLCNINQQLKIQQLALFVPINEDKYFEEITEFKEKLEKAYVLCTKCEKTLQETLEKQEYNLLQNRLNSQKLGVSSQRPKNLSKFSRDDILVLLKNLGVLGLKIFQIIFALILFLALLIHFETKNKFFNLTLPEFAILQPSLPVLEILSYSKGKVYSYKKELSFAGLICCFLAQSDNHRKKHFSFLAWIFLHLSLWSSFIELQVLLSGICFFLNIQMAQNKVIQLNKKSLAKKLGFQPVKRVFSEFHDTLEEPNKPINKMPSSLFESNRFASLDENTDAVENRKVKQIKHKLKRISDSEEKNSKERLKENETESILNEEKEKVEPGTLNSSPITSFTNKSFVPSSETEKSLGEPNGLFSEVYSTLGSLQLGGNPKKPNKAPNFLFANHNFSDSKNSSSIIKPAKFIKNLSSSSWTESNECNSRSSTPSSGYSSQKPVKIEPNRYEFPKTMTPISMNPFNRHSPNSCFDYCDGNHGFYNNMNCFSPGFMPFQQLPGSMGHTAVYTCTRPTNFPFPFSPWQGYPSQKFSPTSRFSDVLDSDNLFQESSKKFTKNKRWFRIKTIFYYCSIFFNFITIMGLGYFISIGIISMDWILPKFQFFL